MSNINSVSSIFLANMTDEQIKDKIRVSGPNLVKRAFPGTQMNSDSLQGALDTIGGSFTVEKYPMLVVNHVDGLDGIQRQAEAGEIGPDEGIQDAPGVVATVRTDTMQILGHVGPDYGIVQTDEAMEAVSYLCEQKDVKIVSAQLIGNGSRVRVVALLGQSEFSSFDGAPNTLGHFAIFEATHDGSACTTAMIFTLRLECFNGMTSREVVTTHKLRHTSKAGRRVGVMTEDILDRLLGDVEAELETFRGLVDRRMTDQEFHEFAVELTGGALTEDASKTIVTRRENEISELEEYFLGGNEGAGPTAWGAYNSVTRWVEAKRENVEIAKQAKKFDSNLSGSGQKKIRKALKMLTR